MEAMRSEKGRASQIEKNIENMAKGIIIIIIIIILCNVAPNFCFLYYRELTL